MDKSTLLLSFKTNEEKLIFSRLLDCYNAAVKKSEAVFSFFLDPASLSKCAQIFEKNMPPFLNMLIFGGTDNSERKMICFTLNLKEQFPISCLKISYNKKFSRELSHRDFLGSILALGIDRKKIGDIIVSELDTYVFVCSDMRDYIIYNLERVGKTAVTVMESQYTDTETVNMKQIRVTTPSLRLDAVIAAGFRLSRTLASTLVDSEKVFVNWRLADKHSKLVSENEVITVRGYGRLVVMEIIGKSKKDKFILNIEISS